MNMKTVPFYQAVGGKAEAMLQRCVGPERTVQIRGRACEAANEALARQLALEMIAALPLMTRLRLLLAHPRTIFPYIFRMRSVHHVDVEKFVGR